MKVPAYIKLKHSDCDIIMPPHTDGHVAAMFRTLLARPNIEEIWREGIVPLFLDKFVIYISICPISIALLDRVPPENTGEIAATIAVMLAIVFSINVLGHAYVDYFHRWNGVRESPLFRAVYVCLCAAAAARHIGGGVVCFTVVTFLPLIYVKVSELLPSFTALYAGIFILLTAVYKFNLPPSPVPDTLSQTSHASTTAIHLVLLFGVVMYHAMWSTSHRHTSDPDSKSLFPYLFVWWRHSSVPLAISRTLIAFLCILARDTYRGRTSTGIVSYTPSSLEFVRVLFLLLTISTFLAWIHCQHSHRNSLSSVLAASVVTATVGILVETAEQSLCLCLVACVAIWVDVSHIKKRDRLAKSD
jgi:hypothetical protein